MELAQTERSETAQSAGPTQSRQSANAGNTERIASIVLGSGLITFGLIRRSWAGWSLAATGATLLYRGSGQLRRLSRARHRPRCRRRRTPRQSRVKIERELSIEGAGGEALPLLA